MLWIAKIFRSVPKPKVKVREKNNRDTWSCLITEEETINAANEDFEHRMHALGVQSLAKISYEYKLGRLNWNILRNIVREMKTKNHKIDLIEGRGLMQREFKIQGKPASVRNALTTFASEMYNVGEISTFRDLENIGIQSKIIHHVLSTRIKKL